MRFVVEIMQKLNFLVNVKLPRCEAASELQLIAVHAGCICSTDYDQILADCLEHKQISVCALDNPKTHP